MLKKRIQFALEILGTGSDARLASGVGITSESLELFLRVLDRNLSLNRQLTTLLDNLAGGDMRRALDFVTQFIGSGHVDTEKIIGIERADPGKYFIPMHEFLRSLLHGDGEFYDPENSPIANLWSIDRPDSRNHFLAPISLHHIRAKGEARDGSGYIDLSDVYHYLQGLGFDGDAVDFTLSKLGHHKLIEAPLSDFDPKVSSQVRVTTVGAYTLSSLPGLFTYNDAVLVDTPIVEAALRQRIIDARTLVDRVERAHIFKLYLDESWNAAGIQSDGWDWSIVSAALEGDMKLVCAKAGIDYESVTVP